MATTEVTSKDRERYARARALGEARAQDPSAVVGARYDPEKDLIELEFAGGSSMTILRKIVPGLERASTSKLGSASSTAWWTLGESYIGTLRATISGRTDWNWARSST